MIFKLITHVFYKYDSETLKFFSCFKIQARKGNTDEWVPQIVLRLKDDLQVCFQLSCLMEHTITRRLNKGAESVNGEIKSLNKKKDQFRGKNW